MKKYALISVSDKTGLDVLAATLNKNGYEILATGNTAKVIKDSGVECIEISEYTSFPEVFSGRVKTLQPQIFGGILMRRDNESDKLEAAKNNINPIDVVCVNLYPFPEVVNRTEIDLTTKIENIDIGGPSLIRAAAKNYKYVSILTDPSQYDDFISELAEGEISLETNQRLAYDAFSYTSYYDTLIANYFEKEFQQEPTSVRYNYKIQNELRYGENPHQSAKLSGDFYEYFEILHGKELSYNNIIDLTAAVELVQDLEGNSCAIIKHTNPCGAATSDNIYDAYEKALSCDPVSAFGGIVSFNSKVDVKTAEKMNEIFIEIICAPDFEDDALEILKKKKNRRLVKILKSTEKEGEIVKSIPGGFMIQSKDNSVLSNSDLKLVTKRMYSEAELEDLKFAWIICKHTKSNAIVYVKDKKAIGVGAGQMSRLDSAKIAAEKAKEHNHSLDGSVAASDAFFPFPDGLIEIAEQGARAVIQPGGSVRDDEVIKAADERNIAMIFTGIRNFKH
ncbi:MAG: bifunctional phosphoribosylaminoimidazolecarboxamide formyltransferase/IMP cyclohydrolase [Melioribacteraceae bacterium]|nr:bifunctional phosphoribosylaminoimidazolecarboxamide formyltransferase/IMP cyclohydrolase [Melioribacteraceae bacterium]MCF8355539.1 bifunctional phosphoribosylaminoimidazolecarboxamide formyltransferase/IMP cyclohydrolase [Melioribacteraceae bacterium]MCF8394506.1 bifunctional phosphoribosylaminoimidazolecarboxamide formyltransferase/IMP cyclohydrolase [Melioribacteraceae bacterium]MCF8420122.1 bifunctional phosphoribosylaminoimidazolecarboxamide formyltransferase/IMP cyclohydrolase [Meliori